MTLVDIDPLKERIDKEVKEGKVLDGWAFFFKVYLDDAPIIDTDRPQGEWIYGEHDVAMCDGYRCNRCDFFVPWDYEHKSIDFINDYHFCPSCGARMKGAEDETN